MSETASETRSVLRRAAYLSFVIGILMLLIKVGAYLITGSAAILSDAAESIVHVLAVAFVVFSMRLSQKPPDESHPYGHAKISFFSAGFEGGLITIAGIFIIFEAIRKWIEGLELNNLGPGTALVALALGINGWLGWYLVKLGRKKKSLILVANGKHVLTDAWTSIGVLIGLGLAYATGWLFFDPVCAILVGLNILWSGGRLMWQSADGLMDRADPSIQVRLAARLTEATEKHGISFHHLRHRPLGDGHWVDLHLIFDDDTSVRDAHELATAIEDEVRDELGAETVVSTHLEPAEDHERIHGHPPE
jgi:cation diffusion facilitator family transporter